MFKKALRSLLLYILVCVGLLTPLAGCRGAGWLGLAPGPPALESTAAPSSPSPMPIPTPSPAPTPSLAPAPTPAPTLSPAPPLAEFTGVVEHIFFHPVIFDPEWAFSGWKANDLDDWMVTAGEYQKILQSLYDKGFILIHLTDAYEEALVDGSPRMVRKSLMLPEGKKPIVISYDDVNYYEYMREWGMAWKLVLGSDGELWDYSRDRDGTERYTQERDIVTILDAFVKEHPDFSWQGAKGTIGLTGYDGILGYQTQAESNIRFPEIDAVRPVVARLKETGWAFASHSFGHPDFAKINLERAQHDSDRWRSEVEPIVGPTAVFLYPYGSDCQKDAFKMNVLLDNGFRFFCAVGKDSYLRIAGDIPAVYMDRRHPDGTTLRWRRSQYLDLYDAKEVFDPARPIRPLDFGK